MSDERLEKKKVEEAWHRFVDWCGYNKHNFGELGDFIKMDYVNNGFKHFVEELELNEDNLR